MRGEVPWYPPHRTACPKTRDIVRSIGRRAQEYTPLGSNSCLILTLSRNEQVRRKVNRTNSGSKEIRIISNTTPKSHKIRTKTS